VLGAGGDLSHQVVDLISLVPGQFCLQYSMFEAPWHNEAA